MNTTNCGDTTGGWMRVAHIDANSVTHNCAKWKLNYIGVWQHCQPDPVNVCLPLPTPMCTRSHSDKHGCSSVTFPTHGVNYTKVCGRARGYQYGYTRAFYSSQAYGYIAVNCPCALQLQLEWMSSRYTFTESKTIPLLRGATVYYSASNSAVPSTSPIYIAKCIHYQ